MNILADRYFEKLHKDFELLSEIVFKQMNFISLLMEDNTNPEALSGIQNNELIIDSLDVKMRNEIINIIVLYNPKATDLRKIMSYYDTTAYLERIGDLIINIMLFLQQINMKGEIFGAFKPTFLKLQTTVKNMTQNAIFAFTCEDNRLAKETIQLDNLADSLHWEIVNKLKTSGFQQLNEQQLTDILSINSMSYNLERIGDNATNIAEAAIYLIEGKNVKHASVPDSDILKAGSEG